MVGDLLSVRCGRPKLASIAATTWSFRHGRHNMHSAASLSLVRHEWAEITDKR